MYIHRGNQIFELTVAVTKKNTLSEKSIKITWRNGQMGYIISRLKSERNFF